MAEFSNSIKQKVWEKGKIEQGYNPNDYRKDECGAWMQYEQYGNRESPFGWEIDHIVAKSDDGSDDVSNLRPLQWENNVYRQNGCLKCKVEAQGDENVQI